MSYINQIQGLVPAGSASTGENPILVSGSDASTGVIRPNASLADGNGGYALEVAQAATQFYLSSGNTSVAQLGAGATFTGTIDGSVNQQSYSILITSDQNGTVVINQFIDAGGTRLSQVLTFPVTAGVGFSRSGVINGNYLQVKFTNNGGSTTTTLNINTYFGTIPSATQLNNAPIALNEVNGSALSLGQATSAASIPVVLSSDQSGFNVGTAPTAVYGTPTTISMAALNATVQYQADPSSNIYLSLTNGPGATTAWVGTVTFQYSINNGTTWSPLTVFPAGGPTSASGLTGVTTSTTNGFWFADLPSSVGLTGSNYIQVRANMTAYTSGTVYFFVSSQSVISPTVVVPWTYSVTSGTTVVGPLDASSIQEIDLHMTAITTAVYTWQGTNDPTLTTWNPLDVMDTGALTNGATTISTVPTGAWRVTPSGFKWVRLQCTTTGTVWTVQGVVAKLGTTTALSAYGNAIGVNVNGGTLPTVTTVSTVSTVTSMTSGNLGIPGLIADVASAAITTTTTTATLTPTYGTSYSVNIPVTVVSGTTPTMDVEIQESADSGTNWYAVYDFPRITAVGSYNSPPIMLTGNRIRYVQTIGGTTPSFTRAINRLQESSSAPGVFRQTMDRTIVLTTLSSTTVSLFTAGAKNAQLIVNIGTTTIAPVLQLQGSDDFGATWYSIGSTLTAVASSTVQLTVNNISSAFIRAIVTTAGTATVAGYVALKAF